MSKKVTATKSVGAKKNVATVVKAAAPKKINVSAGVIAGNKLGGMTPQYPAIAKPARIKGASGGTRARTAKKSGTSRSA
ncbi:MAG TPA: hypothetical protein VE779_09785 [Candidatus Angelobacter sp.]|nr:hypothetical protein [Candidatus Angelobacter sp.]